MILAHLLRYSLARSLRSPTSNSMTLINSCISRPFNDSGFGNISFGGSGGLSLGDLAVQAALANLASNVLTEASSTIGLVEAAISEWLAIVNIATSSATFGLGLIPAVQTFYTDSPTNRASLEKALERAAALLQRGNATEMIESTLNDISRLLPSFKSLIT